MVMDYKDMFFCMLHLFILHSTFYLQIAYKNKWNYQGHKIFLWSVYKYHSLTLIFVSYSHNLLYSMPHWLI